MKTILLFPGAFNPPHNGHVLAVQGVLGKVSFDELWVMPSGKREDKKISLSYEHRRSLCNLFARYLQTKIAIPVKLATDELDDKNERFTQEILREIKSDPTVKITQLIGLDGYLKLYENAFGEIEKENFIVVKRTGYKLPANIQLPEGTMILDVEAETISSTQVRNLVKERNEKYRELVPREIAIYIEENSLYL